ncbi:E3 ubiquitin-protein ligase HACE1-like isoform X2 [Coccinella septempunctata]|uniref:E3 ubiquitin-protein ligase HACE1-like isoform X2 n=1 Tax=Coccinella septempunctata TaxID=41139 RepID=UPI001D068651|nr:E3 ubiquitin-protein ligase HACE1-like isoform X2 [Coccinella septempunctata]
MSKVIGGFKMLFFSVALVVFTFLIVLVSVNKNAILYMVDESRKKVNKKKYQERINSAFRASIFAGQEQTMLKLLKKGADMKLTDRTGYNCLHHVVVCGHYRLIKHLVEYGADLEQECHLYGYKPIHLCIYTTNKEECLKELLKYGAKPDAVDRLNNTLLHLMVKFRPQEVSFIETLLNYGLNPNATNIKGNTCLHIIAASRSCPAKVALYLARKFLERGGDIDHVNKSTGETSLQIASRKGKKYLVELLLREGAAMDVRSHIGFTAFEGLFLGNRPMTDIITIFIKHIALKKHCGEMVEDSVFQRIASDVNLQIIYRDYDEDLNRLKSTEIIETHWVTLYHILCGKKSEVNNYLSSASVRDNIFSQEVSTVYWKEIRHKFSKTMKMLKLQEQACEFLDAVLDGRLPSLCVQHISKYLSKKDVEALAASLMNKYN